MHIKNKLRVGILGATGMVGQRFISLLANHPWFTIVCVAASPRSAGKRYDAVVQGKWKMEQPIPINVKRLVVQAVEDDFAEIVKTVDFVFCALDMEKDKIKEIEMRYAAFGIPVVSNNSAHRWTEEVPMIIPEVNPDHIKLIPKQQKKHGWKKGFIVVKPNCSLQSYVIILTALKKFKPKVVDVVSLQAISGAGKTFDMWPEMVENVIPFIGGEEEKSEKEPLKIWGTLNKDIVLLATTPKIAATCIRVPVADGHMASVGVTFAHKPTKSDILSAISQFDSPIAKLQLPSAPKQVITYFAENDRPQTRIDRNIERGMGISMGRLREDTNYHFKFIALSHNTIRGAAGGAILMAELLAANNYI